MIDYIISELEVDAESAREIRTNPTSYMITYETFKLLKFQ